MTTTPAGTSWCPVKPWADDFDSIKEWVKEAVHWCKVNKEEYHELAFIHLVGNWWGWNSPSFARVKRIEQAVLLSLEQENKA